MLSIICEHRYPLSEMPVEIMNNVLDIVVMEAEEHNTLQGETVKVEETDHENSEGTKLEGRLSGHGSGPF